MVLILILSLSVLIGLILIKVNPFLAFIIASITAGLLSGLQPLSVIKAIEEGLGNSLGSMVVILGFGAVIGKIMAESGAAQTISDAILAFVGKKHLPAAMVIIGFLVGLPMFFAVAFVITIPILFTVAKKSGLSPMYIGIPLVASLSVTHGLLPPHPAPVALVRDFGAAMSTTLLYGLIIGIPAMILAGPIFAIPFKKLRISESKILGTPETIGGKKPSLTISLLCVLLPVILLILPTLIPANQSVIGAKYIAFVSHPFMSMLLSLIATMYFLGIRMKKNLCQVMSQLEDGFGGVAMLLLIIAGAGAFSEVCSQIGLNNFIAEFITQSSVSPIILCWLIAAGIRLAVGSATVAATTTSGILSAALHSSGIAPELLVLSTCAGSLIFSHVNDGGFWLFREYFNLTVKQTLMTWSVMETIIAVSGLAGCLILNMFI